METAYPKTLRTRYSSPSLPPNLQGKVQDWVSLSYDIVKAHGGELKVESKEGEGSEFVIQFPDCLNQDLGGFVDD